MNNSEQELKTLLREKDNSTSLEKIKQRLAHVTSMLSNFESPATKGIFLLVAKNEKEKSWFPVHKEIINIGRSTKADLSLQDDNISRFHCRIEKENDIWGIIDLDSKNGITINGKKYKQRFLCNGDLIKIGDCTILYFDNK